MIDIFDLLSEKHNKDIKQILGKIISCLEYKKTEKKKY